MADESDPAENGERLAPPWMPWFLRQATIRGILILIAGIWGVNLISDLTSKLSSVIGILFTAFFLSFAIEPAVNWLASRGWRRGSATGLIFLGVFLAVDLLIALVIPAVISGTKQLIDSAPQLVDTFVRWANKFGWHISAQNLTDQIEQHAQDLAGSAASLAGNVFGIAASILGGIFRWATIALFTFYIVAEGPKLRRIICSALPPKQQEHVLFVWDQAIEKTGGYFYSRLLLAVINGSGMYVVLRANGVPFAAPLAIFEGIVAEFIPIIGTYIGGALPILVAFLTSPAAGIWAAGYIVVYQQLENYILSPRLTAKTMSLHPAIAFAAALIGGAIGGLLAAFLALPVAGVLQAAIIEYSKPYEVVAEPKEGLEVAAQVIEDGTGGAADDDHDGDE